MQKSKNLKTISIIGGTGVMGQMFAKAFTKQGYEVLIAGRKTKLTANEAAERGDLVIICVPISSTEKVIKEVGPFVRKEAILVDFTSVKVMPIKAMKTYSQGQIVGAHPVFGPIPDLARQPLVFCPARISPKRLSEFRDLFKSLGLNLIEMSAREHDKQMAVIQCLNHLSNLSFANSIKNLKFDLKNRELFSPAFILKLNLIKRMLAQSPSLYADIETYNSYAKSISAVYLKSLNEIKLDIERGDKKSLEAKIKKIQSYFNISNRDLLTSSELKVPALKDVKFLAGQLAVLGPEYSHSHLLAKQIYPQNTFLFCNNIEAIFQIVSEGRINHGIVPIENMLNGSVRESILSLKKYKIKINGLYHFPIHHCFASKSEKFIKIISHPQAIAQCSNLLEPYRKKGIEIIETTSTSKALEIAASDSTYAAIGSFEGAKNLGLNILGENVENNHHNVTSFILISKKDVRPVSGHEIRTSVLITPTNDHPGLLYEVLSAFKKNNVNLTKIESIPMGEKIGEYLFYLEFSGQMSDVSIQHAIETIQALYGVYVLGSYEVHSL